MLRRFFLDWLLGIGICLHPAERQIKRRRPHPENKGEMGIECFDCGRWAPVATGLSALAHTLKLQQQPLAVKPKERQRKRLAPVLLRKVK